MDKYKIKQEYIINNESRGVKGLSQIDQSPIKRKPATKGFGTKLFDTSQAQKSKPSLVDSVENFYNDFETITNSMVNLKVLYKNTRTTSTFD